MSENLLTKINVQFDYLLTQLSDLKKEVEFLKQENAYLKSEQVNYEEKLKNLISLLDVLDLSALKEDTNYNIDMMT